MKISLFICFILIPFLSFAQDATSSDRIFVNYDETSQPVKGMKFLYGRFGEIKSSPCFESLPDSGVFKILFQFTISEKGKLADDSIQVFRTPTELKPECIAQIRNALDVEWTIPKQMGKPTRQKLMFPLIFKRDE